MVPAIQQPTLSIYLFFDGSKERYMVIFPRRVEYYSVGILLPICLVHQYGQDFPCIPVRKLSISPFVMLQRKSDPVHSDLSQILFTAYKFSVGVGQGCRQYHGSQKHCAAYDGMLPLFDSSDDLDVLHSEFPLRAIRCSRCHYVVTAIWTVINSRTSSMNNFVRSDYFYFRNFWIAPKKR